MKYEIIFNQIHLDSKLRYLSTLMDDEISITFTIFLIILEYAIDKMDNILKEQKSKLRKVRTDGSGLDFSGYGHVGPVFFASGFGRVHCPGSSQESSRNPNPKKVKCDSYIFFFIFAYSWDKKKYILHLQFFKLAPASQVSLMIDRNAKDWDKQKQYKM